MYGSRVYFIINKKNEFWSILTFYDLCIFIKIGNNIIIIIKKQKILHTFVKKRGQFWKILDNFLQKCGENQLFIYENKKTPKYMITFVMSKTKHIQY